jgi:hypothetical protein
MDGTLWIGTLESTTTKEPPEGTTYRGHSGVDPVEGIPWRGLPEGAPWQGLLELTPGGVPLLGTFCGIPPSGNPLKGTLCVGNHGGDPQKDPLKGKL